MILVDNRMENEINSGFYVKMKFRDVITAFLKISRLGGPSRPTGNISRIECARNLKFGMVLATNKRCKKIMLNKHLFIVKKFRNDNFIFCGVIKKISAAGKNNPHLSVQIGLKNGFYLLFSAEANAVSLRWHIIVSYESNRSQSKMYSRKGISCSSVFCVCLFVCLLQF